MSETQEKKLDDALKIIKKMHGAGAIMSMGASRAAENIEVISTGTEAIDSLTGIGGIPRARITEIYGPESGGKSTLCLQIVREAQKLGGVCAYIDAENAMDADYAQQLGVDVERLLLSQPSSGEEALEIALTLVKSGAVMLVVVDSVAALVPKAELEGDIGDPTMGLAARMMGSAMRKMVGAVADTKTALVFVNQVRDKLGVMFGNPETTPGGRALKFASSLRLDVRRIEQIKKGDVIIGAKTKIKSAKNKCAPPLKVAEVPLIYGRGFVNSIKEEK